MATEARKLRVGIFVIIAVVIGLGAAIWLGASRYLADESQAVTFFSESVQGLDPGAAVKYRGVPAGRVDQIKIAPDGDLSGTIRLAERLGTENHLHIDLEGGGSVTCITDGTHPARARDRVRLRIPPADAHVFDGRGNALPRRLDPATQALITDTNRPADPA